MIRIKVTAQHTGHAPIVRPCGKGERRTADYNYWQGRSYKGVRSQAQRKLHTVLSMSTGHGAAWAYDIAECRAVIAFCS